MAKLISIIALFTILLPLVFTKNAESCRLVLPEPFPLPSQRIRPRPIHLKPMVTKKHTADITIEESIAHVEVNAVFYNPNSSVIEGTYFFPLPAGATINHFEMEMNGKMVKAELLGAAKARKIYEDIVAKMKDPGLLEFVGTQMVKCRVYPIPAKKDLPIKLKYSVVLEREGGLTEFTYPLRSAKPENGTISSVAIRVKLKQSKTLKTIYSPSHKIDITRKGKNSATCGFEAKNLLPQKDFKIYFSTSGKNVGLSLMTHKKEGEDGYFLLIVSPEYQQTKSKKEVTAAKDLVFVMDCSGSMAGKKMKQAKRALKFALNSLNPVDRFGIVKFATEPVSFMEELIPASKQNIAKGLEFVKEINAAGGTAIDDALLMAYKMTQQSEKLQMVIFMTDGMPTIGETEPKLIAKHIKKKKARLFAFGVGFDVNTKLLDQLSREHHGASDYVSPEEDIEVKMSQFYQKIAHPVLSHIKLNIPGISINSVYPKPIPDLFRGTELRILGRFKGTGHRAIRITGKLNKQEREFVYEDNFSPNGSKPFLARLWATQKVAYLLEEIRLNGKNSELVKEITHLGKKHGILTPYTSFLIVEDTPATAITRRRQARMLKDEEDSFSLQESGESAFYRARSLNIAKKSIMGASAPGSTVQSFGFSQKTSNEMKNRARKTIIHIGEKTFYLKRDGVLYDSELDLELSSINPDTEENIKAFSKAYFRLLTRFPGIGIYLGYGKTIVLMMKGTVIKIIY